MNEHNPFQSVISQIARIRKYLDVEDYIWDILKSPEKEVMVNFPVRMDDGKIKMFQGFRVQHNSALGPYKGGTRFFPKVDLDEVRALSFWMTIKNALAGLPLGGSKGGVIVDTKKLSDRELKHLAKGYIKAIFPVIGPYVDIPGPDMGATAKVVGYMVDEYKILAKKSKGNGLCKNEILATFTGKPVEDGGSYGRQEATAKGGIYVLQALLAKQSSKLKARRQSSDLTIAVQGFGNVGYYFAQFASKLGFKVVAVSDSKGGVYIEKGLNIKETMKCKKEKGALTKCIGKKITNKEILTLPVDILVPAAVENIITSDNAKKIRAKIVFEMANGPTTPEADEILEERDILVVPDILVNAGGVTVSYFEYLQNLKGKRWSEEEVFSKLKKKIITSFNKVWHTKKKKRKISLRSAAYIVAIETIAGKIKI